MSSVLRALLMLSLIALSGCASAEKKDDASQPVSTLPWNAPAQWEQSGALGGAAHY